VNSAEHDQMYCLNSEQCRTWSDGMAVVWVKEASASRIWDFWFNRQKIEYYIIHEYRSGPMFTKKRSGSDDPDFISILL
jgi:hypothetical protein